MTTEPFEGFRELNAVLTTLTAAGLLWRLIGRWPISNWLGRGVVALFAVGQFIVALGTARAAALEAPFNEAQFGVFAHAIATLTLIAAWPTLLAHPRRAGRDVP